MKSDRNLACNDSDYFVDEIDYREENSRINLFGSIKVLSKSIYSLEAKNKIRLLLDKIQPDVVHMHSIRHHLTKSILPVIAARRIPIVWTLHDYKEICPNTTLYNGRAICEACKGGHIYNVIRYRCKKGSLAASVVTFFEALVNNSKQFDSAIHKYISPSFFLKRKFVEFGYNPQKIEVLPNFLDTGAFHTNHNDDGIKLLYIGRIEREKGVFTLLAAFHALSDENKRVELNIAGDGSGLPELKSIVLRQKSTNVHIHGHVSGGALSTLISDASAIIIPSEWYENYPFSGLEAKAFSKPIIGSRIGGLPEIVREGHNGFLFNPGDPYDLLQKLTKFIALTRSDRNRMGHFGRKDVEAINNPHRYLKRILAIYNKAIRSTAATP